MAEDRQRIIQALTQLWNTGDPKIAQELYTETAGRYDPNQTEIAHGWQKIANYVGEVRTGYPDFRLEVTETVAEGDRIASHWTCTGTHQGEFQGIAPTGKRITISGVALARLENGKIADERVYFDRLTMLEQLGVFPNAAAAG